MQNPFGNALIAYLRHDIPANLWYACSNQGVTQVAQARFVEVKINETRRALKPGHNLKHFKVWLPGNASGNVLHFSDRPELQSLNSGYRKVSGIVGNMAEFQLFCDRFVVIPSLALYVPTTAELSQGGYEMKLGRLDHPEHFQQILELARRIVDTSDQQN